MTIKSMKSASKMFRTFFSQKCNFVLILLKSYLEALFCMKQIAITSILATISLEFSYSLELTRIEKPITFQCLLYNIFLSVLYISKFDYQYETYTICRISRCPR